MGKNHHRKKTASPDASPKEPKPNEPVITFEQFNIQFHFDSKTGEGIEPRDEIERAAVKYAADDEKLLCSKKCAVEDRAEWWCTVPRGMGHTIHVAAIKEKKGVCVTWKERKITTHAGNYVTYKPYRPPKTEAEKRAFENEWDYSSGGKTTYCGKDHPSPDGEWVCSLPAEHVENVHIAAVAYSETEGGIAAHWPK